MELSRRDCLKVAGAAGVTASLVGCAPIARRLSERPEALPLPEANVEPLVRLMNRAGFGPRPGDLTRAHALGKEAYVDSLLAANHDEELGLNLQLGHLDVLRSDTAEQFDLPKGEVRRQLQQAGILRATYGNNPLLERMADFWSNHFNIYAAKADGTFRMGTEQTQVIRKHALGNFGAMIAASAHSPAMLTFLDNPENHSKHPNENYARELMELHTLGVDGGYSQRDVMEVARCFTGWTVENRIFALNKGRFRFDPEQHDPGEKRVLGHVIPAGGGEKDGERVLAILAAHPMTARFIARKLVHHFLGENNPKWVERTAKNYLDSKGDIRAMLRPLLLAPELADGPATLKRPLDLLVSALRATDASTDGNLGIQEHLAQLGQAFYEWPMPDGYPNKTSAWTGSMLPRWNFAHALAHDEIRGTNVRATGNWYELTHGRPASKKDPVAELAASNDRHALALCLAAPTFQWT